jgi:NAD(P)-dependent dehydrogenase (short-subunit alcohol dehydrogenase family)
MQPLRNNIAVVAGATRGAGRGSAVCLGDAGATVYCTGRSVTGQGATASRPKTINETAALVDARGGLGIPVQVDHTVEAQVRGLFERIEVEQGRLDLLVNDVWGRGCAERVGDVFLGAVAGKGPADAAASSALACHRRPLRRADHGAPGGTG